MMCKLFLSLFLILLSHLGFTQAAKDKVLICSYKFNNEKELEDWQIEGEGKAFVRNGKLVLEPDHFQMLKKLMDEGKLSKKNEVSEYQPYVIAAMAKKYGKEISRYYVNSRDDAASGTKDTRFLGGNFNFWNTRFPTGTDFSITFDFKCLYPSPLHMIMFSALGTNGEGIFDKNFSQTLWPFQRNYDRSTEQL